MYKKAGRNTSQYIASNLIRTPTYSKWRLVAMKAVPKNNNNKQTKQQVDAFVSFSALCLLMFVNN